MSSVGKYKEIVDLWTKYPWKGHIYELFSLNNFPLEPSCVQSITFNLFKSVQHLGQVSQLS